mmetsp:Transcript_30125/g.44415  ORF Transcript_30125/g.44415 Transcript_30125/m.44415 type:complete len:98 (-) Transcript_30125:177-470(-)
MQFLGSNWKKEHVISWIYYTDDLVPFTKRSTSGNYYACCVSDRGTTKGWVEPIKRKSDASDIIIGKCEMCFNMFGQYPRKLGWTMEGNSSMKNCRPT